MALLDVWGGVLEVAMGEGVDSGEKSVRSEEMGSIASIVCVPNVDRSCLSTSGMLNGYIRDEIQESISFRSYSCGRGVKGFDSLIQAVEYGITSM